MSEFSTLLSFFIIVIVGCAVGHALVNWTAEIMLRRAEQKNRAIMQAGVIQFARLLVNQGYWFSESPPTQAAIEALGNYMLMHDHFDVSAVRNQWRTLLSREQHHQPIGLKETA